MRLAAPRIPPLRDEDLNNDQKMILAPMAERGPVINIFRTLAHFPEAMSAFVTYGNYVLSRRRNALPPREREIVILRIGYLCRSGYEWTQHAPIGVRAGLTEEEVERIKAGPSAPGWSAADKALLQASDELHHDQFITDATWAALKAHLSDKQCVDLIYTAGQYTQVSMLLNSLGVQIEGGKALDPDLKAY